ncbi:MAG: histidine--tRNA ligase family protein, partial [Methanomassiliicoccaceae archaeon]|nr:histidine--tRNA ligase family protein [Methanomassiliicoccaceae archaeon]
KEYKARIGHIGILRKELTRVGVPAEKMPEVLQKLDKKLYEEAWPIMDDLGISRKDADSIFELTGTVGSADVLEKVPGEESEYLKQVLSFISALGAPIPEIDLGVVRGLDYYTGMVFEIEAPVLGAEKQICGGGSYTLSELFGGEKVFSTGFAVGFDRALLALEKENASYPVRKMDAYVVAVSEEMTLKAFEIVGMLRKNGISADVDLADRKMAKAMKYASSVGAKYVVIAGSEDLKNDSVTLRDMTSGEQKLVKISDLPAAIRDH